MPIAASISSINNQSIDSKLFCNFLVNGFSFFFFKCQIFACSGFSKCQNLQFFFNDILQIFNSKIKLFRFWIVSGTKQGNEMQNILQIKLNYVYWSYPFYKFCHGHCFPNPHTAHCTFYYIIISKTLSFSHERYECQLLLPFFLNVFIVDLHL